MVDGWLRKDLIELAFWDVLMDLTESLCAAGAKEAGKSIEQFETAWSELVGLAFSKDSIELVWERYRQFESDGERERAARLRRAEWLKRYPPKKEGGYTS